MDNSTHKWKIKIGWKYGALPGVILLMDADVWSSQLANWVSKFRKEIKKNLLGEFGVKTPMRTEFNNPFPPTFCQHVQDYQPRLPSHAGSPGPIHRPGRCLGPAGARRTAPASWPGSGPRPPAELLSCAHWAKHRPTLALPAILHAEHRRSGLHFTVWPSTFKRLNLKTCMYEPQKSQSCFQKDLKPLSVCCFISDIEQHPFFKILHSKTLVVGVCLDCGLLYRPFTAELRRQT